MRPESKSSAGSRRFLQPDSVANSLPVSGWHSVRFRLGGLWAAGRRGDVQQRDDGTNGRWRDGRSSTARARSVWMAEAARLLLPVLRPSRFGWRNCLRIGGILAGIRGSTGPTSNALNLRFRWSVAGPSLRRGYDNSSSQRTCDMAQPKDSGGFSNALRTLQSLFPDHRLKAAVASNGRPTRDRLWPQWLTLWMLILGVLEPTWGLPCLVRQLAAALGRKLRPSDQALAQSRRRLGWKPLRFLRKHLVRALADPAKDSAAFYRGAG